MGAPLTDIFSPLSEDERWALQRFVERVDRIRSSSFAQSKSGLRGTLIPGSTFLGGPAWQIGVEGPDEEAVRSIIGDFRQLYKDSGNASAARVMSILKQRARDRGTDAGREIIEALKDLGKVLDERRKVDPWGKLLEEDSAGALVERSPHDILQTWFNGEYFHDEPELAAELTPTGHGAVEMMRLSLHMAIRDHVKYWTALRNLAERVLAEPALQAA